MLLFDSLCLLFDTLYLLFDFLRLLFSILCLSMAKVQLIFVKYKILNDFVIISRIFMLILQPERNRKERNGKYSMQKITDSKLIRNV